MKALLARRPGSRSSSSRGFSSHPQHQEDHTREDDNFYYPSSPSSSSAAATATAVKSERSDSRRTLPGQAIPTFAEGQGTDIGSAPPNRAAPPSSWTRSKSRFSVVSRPHSSNASAAKYGVKPQLNGSGSESGLLAPPVSTTTAPRLNGLLRSNSAHAAAQTAVHPTPFSSYDDRVRDRLERTRRREIIPSHRLEAADSEEQRTSPIVFLVTPADKRVDGTSSTTVGEEDMSRQYMTTERTQEQVSKNYYENGSNKSSILTPGQAGSVGLSDAEHQPLRPPSMMNGKRSASFPEPQPGSSLISQHTEGTDKQSVATKRSLGNRLSRLGMRASFGSFAKGDSVDASSSRSAVSNRSDKAITTSSSSTLAQKQEKDAEPLPVLTPAELASQLSELAVSHGNALMSDEEYRLLRQGLFDRTQSKDERPVPVKSPSSAFWEDARAALESEQSIVKSVVEGSLARPHAIGILEYSEARDSPAPVAPVVFSRRKSTVRPESSGQGSLRKGLSVAAIPSVSKTHRMNGERLNEDVRSLTAKSTKNKSCDTDGRQAIASYLSSSASSRISSGGVHPQSSIHSASSAASSSRLDRKSFFTRTRERTDGVVRSDSASFASSSSPSTKRRLMGSVSKEEAEERRRELERVVQETRSIRSRKRDMFDLRVRTLSSVSGEGRERTYSSSSCKSRSTATQVNGRLSASSAPPLPLEATLLLASAAALDDQDFEYGAKSSEVIQAEMRLTEAEGKRIRNAFELLERRLSEKGEKLLHEMQQDGSLKGAEHERQRQRTMVWLTTGVWPPTTDVDLSSPIPKRDSRPTGKIRRLSSSLLPSASTMESVSRGETTSTVSASRCSDQMASSPKKSTISADSARSLCDVPPDLYSLRKELANIQSRKEDVARRYEERILFLASKNRAARLREKFA